MPSQPPLLGRLWFGRRSAPCRQEEILEPDLVDRPRGSTHGRSGRAASSGARWTASARSPRLPAIRPRRAAPVSTVPRSARRARGDAPSPKDDVVGRARCPRSRGMRSRPWLPARDAVHQQLEEPGRRAGRAARTARRADQFRPLSQSDGEGEAVAPGAQRDTVASRAGSGTRPRSRRPSRGWSPARTGSSATVNERYRRPGDETDAGQHLRLEARVPSEHLRLPPSREQPDREAEQGRSGAIRPRQADDSALRDRQAAVA